MAAFIGLAKNFFQVSHKLLQKTLNELFGQPNKKNYVYIIGKVKVAQSCPILWDPMDYTVHGILQARTLEWVAFPFSRGSSQPREPRPPILPADSLPAEPQGKPIL